jgi:hypothetical protein
MQKLPTNEDRSGLSYDFGRKAEGYMSVQTAAAKNPVNLYGERTTE